MGDSIIAGIDEKRLSIDRLVQVHDFRGVTLADINHHIIPILKKKPDEWLCLQNIVWDSWWSIAT